MEKYNYRIHKGQFGIKFWVYRYILTLDSDSRESYLRDLTFKPFITHSKKQAVEIRDLLNSNSDVSEYPVPIEQFDEPKLFIYKGENSYYLVHCIDDVYKYCLKVFEDLKWIYSREPEKPDSIDNFKKIDETILDSLPKYMVDVYFKEKKNHDRIQKNYEHELKRYECFLKVKTGKEAYTFFNTFSDDDYFDIYSFNE